jgi:UDP-N-acetylmuramyl tripeptide synthase
VLEVVGVDPDDSLLAGWRARVERAVRRLGWGADTRMVARRHAKGASLALAAPCDQLFTATEVNEWALCAALHDRDPSHWGALKETLLAAAIESASITVDALPPEIDEQPALERLERLAVAEARPDLRALLDAIQSRDLPWLLDDEILSIGCGAGSRGYPLGSLPFVADVPWSELHDVPTALVTGSNGKTTTVRLIAACLRARGHRPGYSCTDGLFVAGETLDSGDYSGPVGARRVLRERRIDAAVLETARGGILRRGLAVSRAHAAVVTNVSADHLGEYGIDSLEALADVKLTVASVVDATGLLVLNADDAMLRAKAGRLELRLGRMPSIGWFSLDAEHPWLQSHRATGGATCGVRDGHLLMVRAGLESDLGSIARMPVTVEGRATYNVANLAGAALAAFALGVEPGTIAAAFASFGADPGDNAGRMMRFDFDGARVLLDYAHNPDGLRGLLRVADGLRPGAGRLGMLLGHAGNREAADFERLAAVAAEFHPDLIVVKEIEGYLRGREPGEVPRIIRSALLRHGLPESALPMRSSELEAARCALDWARPGDVVVLLVHSLAARAAVIEMLRAGAGGRICRILAQHQIRRIRPPAPARAAATRPRGADPRRPRPSPHRARPRRAARIPRHARP